MFVLSILADTLSVHPRHFGANQAEALTYQINKKYANRILHHVGMCVCLFDIIYAGEGKVRYGDGLLWYRVRFRMVVFRPFASEIMIAKIKSSDESGIRVTIGFFDDIHIPATYIPQPSTFDPNTRSYFWYNPQDPPSDQDETSNTELLDTPKSDRWYIEQGDVVRVRVESDEFYDDEPGPPKARSADASLSGSGGVGGGEGADVGRVKRSPYTIVGSMMEAGLGPTYWWEATRTIGEEGDEFEEDAPMEI